MNRLIKKSSLTSIEVVIGPFLRASSDVEVPKVHPSPLDTSMNETEFIQEGSFGSMMARSVAICNGQVKTRGRKHEGGGEGVLAGG